MYIQPWMIFDRFGGTENTEPSLAVQSAKDECDINTIVRQFGVTGSLPTVAVPPTYADFNGIFDYQSAMNVILMAQNSFKGLNADIRARFRNDPHEFVRFCEDPKNLDEMRKMGLAIPREETPIEKGLPAKE